MTNNAIVACHFSCPDAGCNVSGGRCKVKRVMSQDCLRQARSRREQSSDRTLMYRDGENSDVDVWKVVDRQEKIATNTRQKPQTIRVEHPLAH
ncbi:hypothetical protein SAMD00023353_1001060 [Rosellinia necatrix]|uniref:Uncharacterized protein n=1 Tax=Rosellinia necatrix TaxID=77044 RepID=A0A1S8A6F5_ROSNE|nr:hypothetical protein SAMD00023353_1001060 [Rosellinia necatrix]